ncbi:hypothetical protein G6F32_015098 [Rhizopus arrhizus]|nr:hypothetical protein G6F32_015098 [Rhizopus arrhizus]
MAALPGEYGHFSSLPAKVAGSVRLTAARFRRRRRPAGPDASERQRSCRWDQRCPSSADGYGFRTGHATSC